MDYDVFQLETMPSLKSPVFIIGFRGWGNALEVSASMAAYLVDTMDGRCFGRIDSDTCYRYDETRPVVKIEAGEMKSISPPGGSFYTVETATGENDLVVLVADEPSLYWNRFSQELVDLADRFKASAVITLGSMFDNVLHTDRIISVVTIGGNFKNVLDRHGVIPINYHGPSAIHTLILDACRKRSMAGASLWCHCPAYLQGITHHGLMLQLGRLLGDMAGFSLKSDALESRWEALKTQIQDLVSDNPKLQDIIDQIRKKKRQGEWKNLGNSDQNKGKVIDLRDFLDPQ